MGESEAKRTSCGHGRNGAIDLSERLLDFVNAEGEEDAMASSVKQMMEAANAAVPRITPMQARFAKAQIGYVRLCAVLAGTLEVKDL